MDKYAICCVKFPRFDGENPAIWLLKSEILMVDDG